MCSIHLAISYKQVVVSCIFYSLKVYALSEEIKPLSVPLTSLAHKAHATQESA